VKGQEHEEKKERHPNEGDNYKLLAIFHWGGKGVSFGVGKKMYKATKERMTPKKKPKKEKKEFLT